jgi:spore coat-associated protein N
MQRISALWQASPRKLVSALFILLLAAMMAVASGASFTSTSPNANNVVAAGIMKVDTDKSGGAILNIHGLVPGPHPQSGTVTLTNSGDADGLLTLSKSNVVNSSTPGLSGKLDLDVVDQSDGSTVYSGKIGGMPKVDAGSLAKGASKTYKFTVTFPDGGIPSSDTSGDNVYQNQSLSIDYAWNAISQ